MNKHLSIALCAALLAGCGGGGSSVAPAPATAPGSDIPLNATQDANAAVDFVASVAATSSESADPISLGDASLATSETLDSRPL